MKVNVGPVTIEGDISTAGGTVDIYEFLRLSKEQLSNQKTRFILVVDQVDEVFKYDRGQQEKLVQGLFLAEKYITEEFGGRFGVVVLIRNDLYTLYDIQE